MTSGTARQRRVARDAAVAAAVREGLLGATAPLVGLLDVDGMLGSVADLHAAFEHAPAEHTFAAKACSLVPVMRLMAQAGMGCEVASPGELRLALAAGFTPDRIVYDGPVKTVADLESALDHGVALNVDNFQELARVDALLGGRPAAAPIGIRVNPQVGAGFVDGTSTATATSKFGVPLRDAGATDAVVAAFARHPWLTRVHVHVGSLGCPLPLMAEGVAAAYALAEHINTTLGRRQATSLDIGGGLPVDFAADDDTPTFTDYAGELRRAVPNLFDGRYSLVTEFGRSIFAKNGTIATVVEYTKTMGGRRIAVTHAGGQILTRAMSMPQAWPIRIGAFDAKGRPRSGPTEPHNVAGPLCFAGDMTAVDRDLPVLEPGDILALYDTGAYSLSTHFSYNSLPRPAVYGYRGTPTGAVTFALVRTAQTIDEVIADSGAAHTEALVTLVHP
ncbi:diaminopimelate decarboxylase [Embleya scabrispora]|uniref:diaminopimelate decarboxylase n=1 Tax=Embleya scabrispora TaxID=159449 RepID=UPI000593AA1D|nr:diaminopimelate decarboxylase [Embleya scabrispora]MYS86025.1 diaminopimelate decarboxylase [Streptomyces sp. SID5474]